MPWVYNPHSGGKKIPKAVQEQTEKRLRAFAERQYTGKFTRLGIRFRGALCYIDAFTEPVKPKPSLLKITGETREQYMERMRNNPIHLCRLRYFAEDRWSMTFYTYSHETYEPCTFDNGKDTGTPEEAFETAAVYLE